jgi:hypothetical protein
MVRPPRHGTASSSFGRVTFTCDGRLIHSGAMLDPATEGSVYDPIVEEVARGYRLGASRCNRPGSSGQGPRDGRA